MAKDQDTFDALFKIVDVYTRRQGGSIDGAFLDGFKSTAAGDWFCVNAQGACPAAMPWQPGEPDDPLEMCVGIKPDFSQGVDDEFCHEEKMALCQFTL